MSAVDIHLNLNAQTCRVCLATKENEATLCLHDEIEYNEIIVELWQLLENVSKVKCTWNEPNLPTQLCQNCTRRLLSAYEFIREVEKSQQTLQNLKEQQEQQPHQQYEENVIEFEGEELPEPQRELETHSDAEVEENDPITSRSSQLGSRLTQSQKFMYKCAVCPRVFAKNESLARHCAAVHRQTANVAAQELAHESSGSGVLTCEHCPRLFKRQDTLRRHMQAFHPEAAYVPASTEDSPSKRHAKRGECPYCGISFPSSSLTIHIRRHTGENPYKCDQCEKAFPRSQDLSLHRRQHTGERPNECKICSKKFISLNKLARHMRLHTGQRPYACDKCDKRFVQSNDLKIHMRRHTGERPYECGVCGDSFVCGSLLNIHRNQKGHREDNILIQTDPYENARVNKRRAEDMARVCQLRASEGPYKCGVCGWNFKSGALLTIHRNNMAHYELGKINYGDPFGERRKQQLQQDEQKMSEAVGE